MPIDSKRKAMAMAMAASDKKGIKVVIIDMRKMPSVCGYFVITSGTSTTHIRAIADHMIRQLKEKGEKLWHVEGEREASWILIDFGDVVGHVFLRDTRKFYNLEKLWRGAPQVIFKEPGPRKALARPSRKARSAVKKRRGVKKLIRKSAKKSGKKNE